MMESNNDRKVSSPLLATEASDSEWKEYLINKEWEIYWETGIEGERISGRSTEDEDDNKFDSDWYDATVISYCQKKLTFLIRFVGDDNLCEMPLTPTLVRPSVRAWVKRTKFLLNLTLSDCQNTKKTIGPLAPSPAFVGDHIANRREESFEIDARYIRTLVEEQISLRDQLTISNENYDECDSVCDDDIKAFVHQLNSARDMYNWCEENSAKGLAREFDLDRIHFCPRSISESNFGQSNHFDEVAQSQASSSSLKRTNQFNIMSTYKRFLTGLYFFVGDTGTSEPGISPKEDSEARTPNKKRRFSSSPKSQIPRSKRLRKRLQIEREEIVACLALSEECDDIVSPRESTFSRPERESKVQLLTWIETELNSNEMTIHSSAFLSNLIKRCRKSFSLSSFAAKCISDALTTLQCILCPLMEWLQVVIMIVGTEAISDDAIRKELGTSLLLSDEDAMESERRSWAMNDISTCIIQANSDPLLCTLDIRICLEKLQEKLETAQKFEKETWRCIGSCCYLRPIPVQHHDGDKDSKKTEDDYMMCSDSVLQKLTRLQNDATSLPSLSNINLFGQLTKEMIAATILIRQWYIAAWMAHTGKVRSGLICNLLKTYQTLPKIPLIPRSFLNSSDEPPCSVVKKLFSRLKETLAFSVELNNKVINSHEANFVNHLTSESACRNILNILGSQTNVVIDLEEKLTVLADILSWKTSVQHLLTHSKDKGGIPFEELKALHEKLIQLKRGNSTTQLVITYDFGHDNDLGDQTMTFANERIDALCVHLLPSFQQLYHDAVKWKNSATTILKTLKARGNKLVTSVNGTKNQGAIVNIKQIGDLLETEGRIGVTFPEIKIELSRVYDGANAWHTGLNTCLSKDDFCPKECLTLLKKERNYRPKGYVEKDLFSIVLPWPPN
jgi:hypothetical protein